MFKVVRARQLSEVLGKVRWHLPTRYSGANISFIKFAIPICGCVRVAGLRVNTAVVSDVPGK